MSMQINFSWAEHSSNIKPLFLMVLLCCSLLLMCFKIRLVNFYAQCFCPHVFIKSRSVTVVNGLPLLSNPFPKYKPLCWCGEYIL